ncbi:hypothetical protein PCK2_000047 [Pneumocystis canis]|nr:hypothetical protein PCK2_000047 [Pneumocystis canis]
MFRRIEDRRLEKKFRAGIQYSEYAMKTPSELIHTMGISAHTSTMVAHKYDENDYVKKTQKELYDQIVPPFQDMEEIADRCVQSDDGIKNQLSSFSYELTGFFETQGIDTGTEAVSTSEMLTPVCNNKHLCSVYRVSMDANASMRALAPSSRQSSCSSFSSVLTVTKLVLWIIERYVDLRHAWSDVAKGFTHKMNGLEKSPDTGDRKVFSGLIDRLIFSAGLDSECRPLVILNASNFPDAKDVNYDELLERMLLIMDTFVDENDYSMVLFAGGIRCRPSWNWLFQAYQSLGRKYRKHIKALYIVHSTWWIRVMLDCMHHLLSPKFARKIVYVSTLSELAKLVPFRQINVPPDVYTHNLKYESHITLPDTMLLEGYG